MSTNDTPSAGKSFEPGSPGSSETEHAAIEAPLDETVLKRAEAGDTQTLCFLDSCGLIVGATEDLPAYVQRLRSLRSNLTTMETELQSNRGFVIDNLQFHQKDRIPAWLFEEVKPLTRDLYDFQIDWVPGFYVDPSFSWLFGGCAFYFYPDFFALFIIRKTFAHKRHWLIYDRNELLAHELCHVARIGLDSVVLEETAAYRTSGSVFRREVGGVFRSPRDSFLLLGSTLLLLAAQFSRIFLGGLLGWLVPAMWVVVIGVIAFLLGRHARTRRTRHRALERLADAAPGREESIVFRCTDAEVAELATLSGDGLQQWLQERKGTNLRWSVIAARFL